MAKFIPDELGVDAPRSEHVVADALRKLPDSWMILHDVPFGLFGRPRPGLRQVDFLLLHPRQGVIVLEVKGGEISLRDGIWFTKPHGGAPTPLTRSPFSQAADARYELTRFLGERCRVPREAFSHGVVFPDCSVSGDLGPDAPRELTVDERDLLDPVRAVRVITEVWKVEAKLSETVIEEIAKTLKPSLEATVVLAARAARTEEGLARETRLQVDLVESQVETYDELLRSNRAVVLGGAGTGKTVLAVERARRLADAGQKTLLLCHRRAVFSFMGTLLDLPGDERSYDPLQEGKLHLAHWTGLLQALASSRGESAPKSQSPELPEWILDASDHLGVKYDGIVIDEGQEFSSHQCESLTWLLNDPEEGPLYVFADPFQHSGIYHARLRLSRYEPPIAGSLLRLTRNCRNSVEISELAKLFYPMDSPIASVTGTTPEFISAPTPDQVVATAIDTVKSLTIKHELRPNQILFVLIGLEEKQARNAAYRANVAVVDAGSLFRFPLTPIDVRVAMGTPNDVQGLEAEAVVVAYWQPENLTVDEVRDLYISATRARSLLFIVSNADRSAVEAGAGAVFERAAQRIAEFEPEAATATAAAGAARESS